MKRIPILFLVPPAPGAGETDRDPPEGEGRAGTGSRRAGDPPAAGIAAVESRPGSVGSAFDLLALLYGAAPSEEE